MRCWNLSTLPKFVASDVTSNKQRVCACGLYQISAGGPSMAITRRRLHSSTLSCSRITPLSPHYSTNTLQLSPNSPNVFLNPVHGSLQVCMLYDLPSVVLKTSINVLKLLYPGYLSSLFATATTTLYSLLKNCTTLI